MASWEDELFTLLNELGVKQEGPQAHLQQSCKPMRSDASHQQFSDSLLWDDDDEGPWVEDVETMRLHDTEGDDGLWVEDLEMMHHEVDTIVSQVVLLMQRGDLDAAVKEDVMVVLRALRQRLPTPQQPDTNDEAYLESASAILHFCRLVLQLSDFTTEDF
ncbi:hypothetical protein [Dictyobacter arantiisoli]|uniref:Uncharacterized protein n=1 Tax=Dictyobacter arantiisoli TaxID=2014874 RepID=A0A5A5T7Q8_9CHLR|nr:hypothetical protein [Dictyobacter arantiisoli]GCF07246.1 hypothetical protein KDI_08100 [Dictyobacter arantiisoli]